MIKLQEAIGVGLVLGAIHGLVQPAYSVPVVPNFTQGSMTTRTETKQTINETINSMDYSCLLYTSPSPRDLSTSRMPSSA